jgi:DNA-binding response OmpR family regulator
MTKKKTRILLVEDDINLGFLLVDFLESNDFDVKLYRDGESGLEAFKKLDFDFCLLDVMLPKLDGFELAKEIKHIDPIMAVIMLTARAADEDKIRGFNIGVDDYVTKPFNETELVCRIKAILCRIEMGKNSEIPAQKLYEFGNSSFEYKNRILTSTDEERRLTKTESDILQMLCASQNMVVSRADIMIKVWGEDDYFIGRSLDVFISKIRKYLSSDKAVNIETIPNLGLVLNVN